MKSPGKIEDSEIKIYWMICFASLALLLWSFWRVPVHWFALSWAGGIGLLYGGLGTRSRTTQNPFYHMAGIGIAVTVGQLPALALLSRSKGEDWEYALQYYAIILLIGSGFVLIKQKSLRTNNS